MRKRTITNAVLLTATILALTGCNTNSTTSNSPTEPVTTSVSSVETSAEEITTTSYEQETETTSSTPSETETTSTSAPVTSEPTIPETTIAIESATQVAGYDGICEEYGHVEEADNGVEYFLLDEGAPLSAWKDALSKHKWVTNSPDYFYTTMEYKGHTVMTIFDENDTDENNAYFGSLDYMTVGGYSTEAGYGYTPFIYDLDLNLIFPKSNNTRIVDQEVRDGVTWYKYHLGEDCDYWLPEHNGADWEQIYKKYVQEPYEARYAVMTDEEKVNENLFDYEQVWNKTYYNVRATGDAPGYAVVEKMYAYKNTDGSITQSAGWEECDSSIFNGTSLSEHGTINVNSDGVTAYWKYDGNTLLSNTEYNELTSELYYHLIDLYGEECVRWNDHGVWNGETYSGEHDWDVYGDGKDACRSREEHIAKCQGN